MRSACSRTSAWTNIMSTSDPASAERSMPASTETSYEACHRRPPVAPPWLRCLIPQSICGWPTSSSQRCRRPCGRECPRSCHHRRCVRSLAGCSDSPECHQSSRSNTWHSISGSAESEHSNSRNSGTGCASGPGGIRPEIPTQHHHLKFLAPPATFWIELRRSTRLRHFRR